MASWERRSGRNLVDVRGVVAPSEGCIRSTAENLRRRWRWLPVWRLVGCTSRRIRRWRRRGRRLGGWSVGGVGILGAAGCDREWVDVVALERLPNQLYFVVASVTATSSLHHRELECRREKEHQHQHQHQHQRCASASTWSTVHAAAKLECLRPLRR